MAQKTLYRAQSVADQMAKMLCNISMKDFAENKNICDSFSWIEHEQNINLKNASKLTFWKQHTPKEFPPDARAIAVLLNTIDVQMPAASMIMTHDRQIRTLYFSILAMAEISGSSSIVEMGLRRRIVQ